MQPISQVILSDFEKNEVSIQQTLSCSCPFAAISTVGHHLTDKVVLSIISQAWWLR